MDAAKHWQLTTAYTCPQCGKRYAVVEWKQHPRCRQCDLELRADAKPHEPPPRPQGK